MGFHNGFNPDCTKLNSDLAMFNNIISRVEKTVIPNHELKQYLLLYGDGLEILSPKSFRVEIFNTISRMNKKYNKTETLS